MATIEKENATQPRAASTEEGPVNPAATKKQKTIEDESSKDKASSSPKASLRSWAEDGNSPGPVYTLQCMAGNPNAPLPSFIKTSKKAFIQDLLRQSGLDTNGSKAVLLHRLQTELPSVTFELDGREAIQQVLHTFLHYFGWDADHLFKVTLPRRGSLPDGAKTLQDSIPGMWEMARLGYKQYFEEYGMNLDDWPIDEREKKRVRQRLSGELGNDTQYSMQDLYRACMDPEALGPHRVLTGAAFDPMAESYDDDNGEKCDNPQGKFSLQELEVKQGDVLDIEYDFGDSNVFTVKVLKVEDGKVLPEETHGYLSKRAKLVSRGEARIRPQYGR